MFVTFKLLVFAPTQICFFTVVSSKVKFPLNLLPLLTEYSISVFILDMMWGAHAMNTMSHRCYDAYYEYDLLDFVPLAAAKCIHLMGLLFNKQTNKQTNK